MSSVDLGTGRASLGRVLDFAWRAGAFTATDAMRSASLTRSTTIEAIDTLVDVDVLRELPNARDAGEYRAGRPARRFELRGDLGVVVGMDAGDTHLTVQVADLSGEVLVHARADLHPSQSVAERQAAVTAQIASVLSDAGVSRERVLAICAGVAAPVTRRGASPPHPEGFWERTNPHLVELLADWALAVEVKNDAQLAATAEGAAGDAIGCRDYIALLAGERLGAGVVIDGHLLHGAHGGVGEMLAFDAVRGVDSAYGLGPVLEKTARSILSEHPGTTTGLAAVAAADIDAQRVLSLAAVGDPLADLAVQRTGQSLARIVGVLGSMFDPERIIVCGSIADGIEPVLAAARAALPPRLHLPAPQLFRSRLGGDVVVRGAVSRALEIARDVAVPRLAEERLRRG
jgi:predicted NBD/HSP70 family sugar kinase